MVAGREFWACHHGVWLSLKEAEIIKGEWINPDDGKVTLGGYAETWIEEVNPMTSRPGPQVASATEGQKRRQHDRLLRRSFRSALRPARAQLSR